jgi:hypothetical protein
VLIEAERLLVGTQQPVTAYFPLTAVDIWGARSSFESVALYAGDGGAFSNGSRTEVVEFATVSGSFFSTLGSGVRLGRPLGPADDAAPFIVISEGLWRRAFGGATDVIGQQVMLNSQRGDGGQRALWRRAPSPSLALHMRRLGF